MAFGPAVDRGRQPRLLLVRQPVVHLADVADRVGAALGEERVGTEGHAVPDVQSVGDVQVGQEAGEGTVLRVEELVVAGVERPVGGQEAVVADDRVHAADLHVHAALGEDRQVRRQVQVAEVLTEVRIADRVADAALGLAQGRVGTGEVPDVEADVELVLLERLLDHEADLVEQELVAEAVLPGLDGEQAGAGRRAGVAALDPAEGPDAAVAEQVLEAQVVHQELHVRDGRRAQPERRRGPDRYLPRARPAATPPPARGRTRQSKSGVRPSGWRDILQNGGGHQRRRTGCGRWKRREILGGDRYRQQGDETSAE